MLMIPLRMQLQTERFGKISSGAIAKMATVDDHHDSLVDLLSIIALYLGFSKTLDFCREPHTLKIENLGDVDERTQSAADIINTLNYYIQSQPPNVSRKLRLAIVRYMPHFLRGYQSLRFPQISQPESKELPLKHDLSTFPEIISTTGLFVPVSTCLRLIAVSLIDDDAKHALIESDGVKAIVSHMVDDPLNPYQREAAVFVIKIFTMNFPPGQDAISKVMQPPAENCSPSPAATSSV